MNARRACIIAILASTLAVSCAPGPPRISPEEEFAAAREKAFRRELSALLEAPELEQSHVGLAAWSLDRREWIAEHDADKLFVPASNAKLLVAAAALKAFGPARRFQTTVLTDSLPTDGNGTLPGNLYLVADGAPDLTTADLLRAAERLRVLGYTRVAGSVIADASCFDSTAYGPGWMWDEGPFAYNAPVSSFMLNGNCVLVVARPGDAVGDTVHVAVSPRHAGLNLEVCATTRADTATGDRLRVDRTADGTIVVDGTMAMESRSVTVRRAVADPTAYARSVFAGALSDVGIDVIADSLSSGVSDAPDSGAATLAIMRSDPMDVLVRRLLKESDNLVGEALVKQLGRMFRGEGTWSAGLSSLRMIMHESLGLDSTRYRIADGSGLSRYTELSPRQIVDLILAASEEFTVGPEFLSALPLNGVDGTLSRRLAGSDTSGYIRGKTGTMSGASALSGVLETHSGERVAYSIMVNGFVGTPRAVSRAQDRIVAHLRLLPARLP